MRNDLPGWTIVLIVVVCVTALSIGIPFMRSFYRDVQEQKGRS